MNEDDIEPVRGLPEALPEGERMLWQGSPDWKALAVDAFHIRAVAFYFAALATWRFGMSLTEGASVSTALAAATFLLPIAAVAIAILLALAVLTARTTIYTITNRRIALRIGIALSVTLNIPFALIDGVDLRADDAGSGDLTLRLAPEQRLAWLTLWPHARPWRLKRPEPMMRGLKDARDVARVLAGALSPGGEARIAPARIPNAPVPAPAGAMLAS